ncbi:MAG: C25 family cysteine peptidase [bacterium]
MKSCLRLVLGLALVTLIGFSAFASEVDPWIAFDGVSRQAPPIVEVRAASPAGIDLNYRLTGILRETIATRGGDFTRLAVVDGGIFGEIGHPELLAIRKFVCIPYGAEATLQIVNVDVTTMSFDELAIISPPYPVQAPIEKIPGAWENAPFNFDEAVYATDAFQLPVMVKLGEIGIIRGYRFVEVILYPLDINPGARQVKVLNSASLRISLSGSDMELTRAKRARYGSLPFESMTDRLLVKTSLDQQIRDLNGMPEPPLLLIITEPAWGSNADLLNYIEWKFDKGFRPVFVTTTQTGSTAALIKAYIQQAYDTWPIPPTFVLLIGDSGPIPAWTGSGEGSPKTDLNYSMLEGTDYWPDVDLGRWSVADLTDITNIIMKTRTYELNTMTGGVANWQKRAVFMASEDNYTVSEGTHNFVITNYLQPDGYTCDRLYCHTYSATTQQVRDAHNAGRSLSTYSGHGAETYWADGPVFYQSDVNNLTNTVYPYVQSYSCVTGNFTYSSECFMETWIRDDHAAIGAMGSSVTSYWTEDDILEKRVFEGFCANVNAGQENQTWMGGMMNYGKIRYYAYFGNTSTTRRYFEMYNIMGDASVDLWTAIPVDISVTHDAVLFIGMTTFDVTVSGISDWALVCVHDENDEIYSSQYLFANGTATMNLGTGATTTGTLHITVTGHDCDPYQAAIPITVQSGPYVITRSETIDDIPGGNGNGLADFGETLDITLTEENLGTEDALNVTVTIATTDDYLGITDGSEYYGTIQAGQQATIPEGFEAVVHPNVPDGRVLHVSVTATEGARDEWYDSFDITAHAPRLSISSAVVNDATGNGNGVMDAGETVGLTLTLLNSGSSGATSLVGTLTTDHDDLNVTVNTGTLAILDPGHSGSMTAFTVQVLPSAPSMDRAFFYLEVDMAGGRTEYVLVELPIGGFYDTIENGQGGWTHAPNQAGWTDQWHISTEKSHSPTHAWKCGDTGTGTYASHMDAVLVTPTINLTGRAELRFWHWMEAEVSSYYPDSAYDGGIVQISADGGPWTQLTPAGGYNKVIRCTAGGGNPYTGPFTCRTPCFGGTINWTEVVCDLASYSGNVQIRFRFGSDNSGALEGWYVDDVRVVLVVANNAPQNLQGELIGSTTHLTWQSPPSAALASLLGYNIYRNGGKIDSLIQALHYEDPMTDLPFGPYTYQVSAQYSNGESGLSNSVQIDWTAELYPVADLTVVRSGDDVILRWTPTNADEYHIYDSDDPENFVEPPVIVTAPPYTCTGHAATFEKRFYRVVSVRN